MRKGGEEEEAYVKKINRMASTDEAFTWSSATDYTCEFRDKKRGVDSVLSGRLDEDKPYRVVHHNDPRIQTAYQLQEYENKDGQMESNVHLTKTTGRVFAPPKDILSHVVTGRAFQSFASCVNFVVKEPKEGDVNEEEVTVLYIARIAGNKAKLAFTMRRYEHGITFSSYDDKIGPSIHLNVQDGGMGTSLVTLIAWYVGDTYPESVGSRGILSKISSLPTLRKSEIVRSVRSGTFLKGKSSKLKSLRASQRMSSWSIKERLEFLKPFYAIVPGLFKMYANRGEAVSAADATQIMKELKGAPQPTKVEAALILKSLKLLSFSGWTATNTPDAATGITRMYKKIPERGSEMRGMAKCTFDSSAERIFAMIWDCNSEDFVRLHLKHEGSKSPRLFLPVPNSHSAFTHTIRLMPSPIKNICVESWRAWMRIKYRGKKAIAVASCPLDLYDGDDRLKDRARIRGHDGIARAWCWTVTVIVEVAEQVCEVTHVFRTELESITVPKIILDRKLSQQLIWVSNMQEKMQRSDQDVDWETRGSMVATMKIMDGPYRVVSTEQRKFIEKCRALMTQSSGDGFSTLTSSLTSSLSRNLVSSLFSSHSEGFANNSGSVWEETHSPHAPIRVFQQKNIHHESKFSKKIKMEVILDCSAEEAASYCFSQGGRGLARKERRAGKLVVPLARIGENDTIRAEVIPIHPILSKRELAIRTILTSGHEQGSWVVAAASVEHNFDNGESTKAVRASSQLYIEVDALGPEQCTLTAIGVVDSGRSFMKSVANYKVEQNLFATIRSMPYFFTKDEYIDEQLRTLLKERIVSSKYQELHNDEELELCMKYSRAFTKFKDKVWEENDFEDPFVKIDSIFDSINENTTYIHRAVQIIDADAAECAAWELSKMSREQMRLHRERGGLDRYLLESGACSFEFGATTPVGIVGFAPRKERDRIIWDWRKDILVTVYVPVDDALDMEADESSMRQKKFMSDNKTKTLVSVKNSHSHSQPQDRNSFFSSKASAIQNKSLSFWIYESLPEVAGTLVRQTRVTFYLSLNMPGFNFIREKFLHDTFIYLSRMRQIFDKSREIDTTALRHTIVTILSHQGAYSPDEDLMLGMGRAYFHVFEKNEARRRIRSNNPFITCEIAHKEGDSISWSRVENKIRASKEEILAFILNFEAKCRWTKIDRDRQVLEKINSHSETLYHCTRGLERGAFKIASREAVAKVVWKKQSDESYIYVQGASEHESRPYSSERIRLDTASVIRISDLSDGRCKAVYVYQLDMAGSIPVWAMTHFSRLIMNATSQAQEYFLSKLQLDSYDEGDGRDIAELMVAKNAESDLRRRITTDPSIEDGIKMSKVQSRIAKLFQKLEGLRALREKHEFVEAMMTKVVECKLRPTTDIKLHLAALSVEDARAIGASFAGELAIAISPEAAVDAWILRYPALKEIDDRYIWFRPMMNVLAKKLLSQANFGLKFRVVSGALLSIMDQVTDIAMITEYMRDDGEKGQYGLYLSYFLLASIFLQCFLTFVTRTKNRIIFVECILCFLGLKPILDAVRIARGNETSEDTITDPIFDLTAGKGIHMFCESIPATLVQTYVILKDVMDGKAPNLISLSSIIVSTLTTGFTAATISYDFDTDPENRKKSPQYYGFILDNSKSRSIMFILLTFGSTCLMTARCLSYALLYISNEQWLLIYVTIDYGAYFVQKFIRGDLLYWIPLQNPMLHILVSFLSRTIVKGINDFTSIPQFRHPNELGGLYWSLTTIGTIMAMFGSVAIYGAHPDASTVIVDSLRSLALSLALTWAITFAFLLSMMEFKFRRSFWSLQTGWQWSISFFKDGETDEIKSFLFENSARQWKHIIGEEVGAWLEENWDQWKEEKPKWFTDILMSKIPLEYIPVKTEAIDEKRRRASSSQGSLRRIIPIAPSLNRRKALSTGSIHKVFPVIPVSSLRADDDTMET